MSAILLLAASLAASPVPVSPQFHRFESDAKATQVLVKQLARPAPVLFETRMRRGADGQLVSDCDSLEHERVRSMPSFGVHLRRP
jgi:hypothetical protein